LEPLEEIDLEEATPTISSHALVGIITPQTLKVQGYIKNKMVTILIDSSSTDNFIDCNVTKYLNLFVYPSRHFQVMIAYEGTINFPRKFHRIKLNMGEYFFYCPIISIQMVCVDVVLGFQWLQSLGTVAFNSKNIFMRFSYDGKEIDLRGIQGKPFKLISSNSMKTLQKKGHHDVVSE
jgi:hypothetical protein